MTEHLLEWADAYLIGIEELDYEHKELFTHINELYRRLAHHNDQEKVEDCLENIYLRMEAHFALEETFMQKTRFIGYKKHKEEHERFLDDMREAIEQFRNNPDRSSGDALLTYLKHWVIDHILTSDRQLARTTERR